MTIDTMTYNHDRKVSGEYRKSIVEEIGSPQLIGIGHRIRKPQHFQKGNLMEDLP